MSCEKTNLCCRLVAGARPFRLSSFEVPKPAIHQLRLQVTGQLPEPVARHRTLGQDPETAGLVADELVLSPRRTRFASEPDVLLLIAVAPIAGSLVCSTVGWWDED